MGHKKEGFCLFILLSLFGFSVSRPSIKEKRSIVKDYGPLNPSTSPQFEKGEDGKYYLKVENLNLRNGTFEYETPIVNESGKFNNNRSITHDAQLTKQDEDEKDSISFKTSGSEIVKAPQFEKREDEKYYLKVENLNLRNGTFEYETLVVNESEKVNDNRSKTHVVQLIKQDEDEKNSILLKTSGSKAIKDKAETNVEKVASIQKSKIGLAHPEKDLSEEMEKDETKAASDALQQAKKSEENFKLTKGLETKYRNGEEKSQDGHIVGDAAPEKDLEMEISITAAPNKKKTVVAQDETQTVDEKIMFEEAPDFPSVPMMMSVLPFILPLAFPSRSNLPLLPLPPALQISDRLPAHDDVDVIKHMDVPRELIPNDEATKVAQKLVSGILQRVDGNQLFDPSALNSLISNAANDSKKYETGENPKILDIMGRKFSLKSQMQEHPMNGMGRFFIRFMSIRPLESELPLKSDSKSEKERPIEVKYRQPLVYDPDELKIKKDEEKPENNMSSEELSQEVISSKAIEEHGPQDFKTMPLTVQKRKLNDDFTTFKINELRTKEPEALKKETWGRIDINRKDSSHNPSSEEVDDTERKFSDVEIYADENRPGSLAKSTEIASLEESNPRTEVKLSSVPVEGDVTVYKKSSLVQSNRREGEVFNISDKNELLESKIVTSGYSEEVPSTKDGVKLKGDKAETSVETSEHQETDREEKNESQSEEVKNEENGKLTHMGEKKKEDFVYY